MELILPGCAIGQTRLVSSLEFRGGEAGRTKFGRGGYRGTVPYQHSSRRNFLSCVSLQARVNDLVTAQFGWFAVGKLV